MYTTIIHPIRKALCLSVNEYCVLDAVYRLSQNVKYNGWCIMSKKHLAEDLDLSERSIFDILETLVTKNLIEKNQFGHLRTKDAWNELMANSHDYYIAFNGKESQFVSGKPIEPQTANFADPYAKNAEPMQKLHTPYAESAEEGMQKVHSTYAETSYNNNKTIINNNNINKESTNVEGEAPKEYGNPEINKMLEALKGKIGITAFADSQLERNFGKHFVNLLAKIGRDEFVRRLDIITNDSFKRKNCNRIKYLYHEIQAFIEPINTSIKSF